MADIQYNKFIWLTHTLCPQVVISINVEAIKEVCAKLKEDGAKHALHLVVDSAFHSPLIEMASYAFSDDDTMEE